jgi:hypothetical protein
VFYVAEPDLNEQNYSWLFAFGSKENEYDEVHSLAVKLLSSHACHNKRVQHQTSRHGRDSGKGGKIDLPQSQTMVKLEDD